MTSTSRAKLVSGIRQLSSTSLGEYGHSFCPMPWQVLAMTFAVKFPGYLWVQSRQALDLPNQTKKCHSRARHKAQFVFRDWAKRAGASSLAILLHLDRAQLSGFCRSEIWPMVVPHNLSPSCNLPPIACLRTHKRVPRK